MARGVDPEWLPALAQELGAPVELLGGALEAVDGAAAGHVILGVPEGRDLAELLASRGLHAAPVDVVPETEAVA